MVLLKYLCSHNITAGSRATGGSRKAQWYASSGRDRKRTKAARSSRGRIGRSRKECKSWAESSYSKRAWRESSSTRKILSTHHDRLLKSGLLQKNQSLTMQVILGSKNLLLVQSIRSTAKKKPLLSSRNFRITWKVSKTILPRLSRSQIALIELQTYYRWWLGALMSDQETRNIGQAQQDNFLKFWQT